MSSGFPFGLGGQFLAGPSGVGFDVPTGDVDYRVVVEPADVAARPIGPPPPIGAEFERPPFSPVAQIHGLLGRRKDQRAGLEHVRQSAWIILRVRCDLGNGDVAGRIDEFAELAIGDRCAVHPELVHGDAVDRRFLRIMPVRTHAIGAARHVVAFRH
jgi:hypothetical protein